MEMKVPDRFSDLPRHMIHHIVSFLDTKDIIRIRSLSKTFVSVSKSFLVVDFDYEIVGGTMSGDQFLNHVTASLEQHKNLPCGHEDGKVLQKFALSLDDDTPLPDNRFEGALGFASENSVKDLCLVGQDHHPPLPAIAFAKSVTKLTLNAFNLDNFNQSILCCPLIRELRLYNCRGLTNFKFSSSIIRTVKLKNCKGLKGVEINSSSLQCFSFLGYNRGRLCESFSLTNCKSLKFLSMCRAPITDSWVNQIVTQLETIKLSYCRELSSFKVSNLSSLKRIDLAYCKRLESIEASNLISLKRIDLAYCERLESIEIGAINLENFRYRGMPQRDGSVSIDIGACKHLKELELGGDGIPKELLQGQVSKFLELETLVLFLAWFREKVEISLQNLKSLNIFNPLCADIRINAPRLVSFRYSGKFSPLHPLRHETTLEECVIWFYPESVGVVHDTSYFLNWFEFLLHLVPCKKLELNCDRIEDLVFPQELRNTLYAPLVDLKNLVIRIEDSSRVSTEMMDSLFWMSPYLETLVFNWVDVNSLQTVVLLSITFEYETMIMKKEDICCLALPTEFSSLKHVEMESTGNVIERDNLLKYFKGKSKSVKWK